MKKTLIASAIAAAVAAPAVSFADVKISGNVIQEFVADDDGTHNKEGAAKSNIDDGLESKAAVDLVFSVSEDLGNGMSAFAKIHTLRDNGGSGNADQVVGLKGDFGTITVGRMEDFSEGKVAAMAATDASDTLSIEPNGAYDTGRAEGGIAYVSPSFNGLTFGIAGYALPNGGATNTVDTVSISNLLVTSGGASNGSGQPTLSGVADVDLTFLGTSTNLDADAKIDATDIMVEYANGPLLVRVARETIDKKATKAGASGQDQETDSIAISYKMDNITLVGYAFDVENGQGTSTNDADGYFVGAKMAMGANTFGIGYTEETDIDASGSTMTVDTTNGGDNESWMVSVDHALSKRTSVTAAYMDVDDVDANADKSVYAIGLKHVF
jgi:predicted porin